MAIENMELIGLICRKARLDHGYTLEDVANKTHYTRMNISRYERGQNNNAYLLAWYIVNLGVDLREELKRYEGR